MKNMNSKSYFHSFEVFHFIPEFTYWRTRLKLLVALKILTATKRYIYTFVEATPVMIVWRHRNCDNVKTKGKFTVMLGASAAHFRVNNRFQCIETLFCLQHCCLLRTSAEMYKRMHKHIDRICICHSHFVWDLLWLCWCTSWIMSYDQKWPGLPKNLLYLYFAFKIGSWDNISMPTLNLIFHTSVISLGSLLELHLVDYWIVSAWYS